MSNVIVFSSPVTPLQWHYRHCGILNPCGELASSMDFDIASLKDQKRKKKVGNFKAGKISTWRKGLLNLNALDVILREG